MRSRTRSIQVAAVLLVATYLSPFVQIPLSTRYLEPKLETARAMAGDPFADLTAKIGSPNEVIPKAPGVDGSYAAAIYRCPWTPLSPDELVVPLSADALEVSVLAHLAD